MKFFNVLKSLFTGLLIMSFFCSLSAKDAEYEIIKYEYFLKDDGSSDFVYSQKARIFSSYAINRSFGESYIPYNPEWQELKINHSFTVMKDGTEIESPRNALNEVLPRQAAASFPYMNLREMVLTHTALEKGALIDYEYTIETKAGFKPGLLEKIVIGRRDPVKLVEILVTVPKGVPLQYEMLNFDKKPTVATGENTVKYRWVLKSSDNKYLADGAAVESGQPALEKFVPVLKFSSGDMKSKMFEIIHNFDKKFEFSAETANALKQKIEGKFPVDQFLVLKDLTMNSAYVNIYPEISGYHSQKAEDFYNSNSGSIIDRAIFFVMAVKRLITLNAYLYFLSDDELVPDLDYPVVYIKLDSKEYLIDLMKKQNSLFLNEYLGGKKFLIDPLNGDIRKLGEKETKLNMICSLKLCSKGISGDGSLLISGSYIPSDSPEKISKEVEKSLLSSGYDGEVSDMQNEGALNFSEKFTVKDSAISSFGELYVVNLPFKSGSINNFNFKAIDDNRQTPVYLDHAIDEKYQYLIEFKDGYEIIGDLKNRTFEFGSNKVNIEWKKDENKVFLNKSIVIKNDMIEPDKYSDFLNAVRIWKEKEINRIIFRKK